jgi:hypothetical protein
MTREEFANIVYRDKTARQLGQAANNHHDRATATGDPYYDEMAQHYFAKRKERIAELKKIHGYAG